MIQLTRLNNQTFLLNAVYIEQVQAFPDTTITLVNGRKIVVKDDIDLVEKKIIDFYKKIGLISTAVIRMEDDVDEGDDDV